MINTVPAGICCGAGLGIVTGWLSRLAHKKTLNSPVPVFFAVFAGGMVFRLAALLAGVCLLRHERYIIIIGFAAALILVQMAFEVVPLKK